MKLYNYWRSSSSWRVRIALHWKQLPFDYQAVNLLQGAQAAPDFQSKNPWGGVPVLEVDGQHLSQSMAILEYLEERHPTPPLLPRDLLSRARVRERAELINSGIQPLQNLQVMKLLSSELKVDDKAFVRHFVHKGLVALEELLKRSAGSYSVGDEVSLADVLLVPQLYSARRFGVELSGVPTCLRIERALQQLPAFTAAHADRQPDAVN